MEINQIDQVDVETELLNYARRNVRNVYFDGGLLSANAPVSPQYPTGGSKLGGTYAWVWTDEHDELLHEGSGLLLPSEKTVMSVNNSYSELAGLCYAIKDLPAGWSGNIFGDNLTTMQRMFGDWAWKDIPPQIKVYAQFLSARLGDIQWTLLSGHPNKQELKQGYADKVGKTGTTRYPVSKWNVHCDKEANRVKADYFRKASETEANGHSAQDTDSDA